MKTDKQQEESSGVVIGEGPVSLDGIIAVARRGVPVRISGSSDFRERMERARAVMYAAIEADVPVYGVTTGYGKSCGKRLKKSSVLNENTNLMRFHGCGTGEPLGWRRRGRPCSAGCSVWPEAIRGSPIPLLEHLAALLNTGITPVVPCEGSVGASGDLTPLSYILAVLAGEREAFYGGERMAAGRALKKAKLKPYRFGPKETLALVNGTSVMTGIAAIDPRPRVSSPGGGDRRLRPQRSCVAGQGRPLRSRDRRGQAVPRSDPRGPEDPDASGHPGNAEAGWRRRVRRPSRIPIPCAAPRRSWES